MHIGYARTSTLDQTAGIDAQIRDLKAAGADKIFSEKTSSIGARPQLDAAMEFARADDVLVVTKPDRLARSTSQLLQIVDELTGRGVGVVILSMGGERLDTRNPTSKLMLTILAGVAAWEREIMLERQREGIAKAKAEGKYTGRKASISREDVTTLRDRGVGPAEIARQLGVARSSVYRLLEDGAEGIKGVREVV
jgi:DNA invertase Pin-like site-specific DNA recombinase